MFDKDDFLRLYNQHIHRPGAKDLLEWMGATDFFTAPASTKYHNNRPGGLVDHSVRVFDNLCGDTEASAYSRETLTICGLLHDLCKADYYTGEPGKYRVHDRFPFGHGEKSVYLITRFMRLEEEEALAVRWHMGSFDDSAKGGSRALSAAIARTPLVLLLHTADMKATKTEEVVQ